VAVLLLALEGALRAFWPQDAPFFSGLFVADPVIGMRHVPLLRSRMPSEASGSVAVRINSRGYRGPEYPWDAPAGFRILGLGDSFAFGFGVEEEDTYLARLERALAGVHAEVINAGLAGMGTDNEARLLAADGPALRPDLVLVGFFVGNDLMDVLTGPMRTQVREGSPALADGLFERWYRPLRPGVILPRSVAPPSGNEGHGLPIPFKTFLRRHSLAYRFLSERVGRLRMLRQGRRAGVPATEFTPFRQEAFCIKRYPPEFDEAWARTTAYLAEMKGWCDAHHARLAVVVIPAEAQVYPDRWAAVRARFDLRDEDFDLEKPERLMAAFAAEKGLPLVDLLPALRAARDTGGPLYFKSDIHWTPRGHAVAADEILRQLRARGLVPAG
jgi:lysophospholipase L1-like esterase